MQTIEMGVAELTKRVILAIESDDILNNVTVRGEISNFKYSGPHAYFSLKEGDYLLNCVMFNASYKIQNRTIPDGTTLKANGSVKIYAKKGYYQLYVEFVQEGKDYGDLYRKLEELKAKLKREGIFEKKKREIPIFPRKIAVVASRTSAAFQDVVRTIKKRYPIATIFLFHTLVQGKDASQEIVKALDAADEYGADVVLLVRGGGSIEDLWNFNEEIVVKKVYDMKTPIITGVGHEIDFTLVDYVADLRAPTPTGAAEFATPDVAGIKYNLDLDFQRIANMINAHTKTYGDMLDRSKHRLALLSPERILILRMEKTEAIFKNMKNMLNSFFKMRYSDLSSGGDAIIHSRIIRIIEMFPERIDSRFETIKRIAEKQVDRKISYLEKMELSLNAHDPDQPVKRGYAMIFKEDLLVRSVSQLQKSEKIRIVLSDGQVISKVEEIKNGREKNR